MRLHDIREAAQEQLDSVKAVHGEQMYEFTAIMIELHKVAMLTTDLTGMTDLPKDAQRLVGMCLSMSMTRFTNAYGDALGLTQDQMLEALEWSGTIFKGVVERLNSMEG